MFGRSNNNLIDWIGSNEMSNGFERFLISIGMEYEMESVAQCLIKWLAFIDYSL